MKYKTKNTRIPIKQIMSMFHLQSLVFPVGATTISKFTSGVVNEGKEHIVGGHANSASSLASVGKYSN
jgi:hypothetical protein